MVTLLQVLQLSAEWVGLCPLLQGIAHMICRSHKHNVRQTATSYLQRAVLAPQLNVLCAMDWHACFSQVGVCVIILCSCFSLCLDNRYCFQWLIVFLK